MPEISVSVTRTCKRTLCLVGEDILAILSKAFGEERMSSIKDAKVFIEIPGEFYAGVEQLEVDAESPIKIEWEEVREEKDVISAETLNVNIENLLSLE